MREYADSSFLVSLYVPHDVNHTRAAGHAQRWQRQPPGLPLTPFGAYEFNNALLRLAYFGHLHPGDLGAVGRMVADDLSAGLFESRPLEAYRWIEEANRLTRQITPHTGTRALDVLHLALARLHRATVFLSFDNNQRRAAEAAGFTVLPPAV